MYGLTTSISTTACHWQCKLIINKKLSYRRETELQGALVLAKSGRMGLGDDILCTSSTTVT